MKTKRICGKCGENKSIKKDFYSNANSNQRYCKQCMRDAVRASTEKKKALKDALSDENIIKYKVKTEKPRIIKVHKQVAEQQNVEAYHSYKVEEEESVDYLSIYREFYDMIEELDKLAETYRARGYFATYPVMRTYRVHDGFELMISFKVFEDNRAVKHEDRKEIDFIKRYLTLRMI